MTKIMENKANQHETNLELQSLNSKVEDIYRDLSKRLTNCALQKDFAYLQTVIETKANIDDVNESLQGKANKQSVANALHRKANRSDID
jgi:flagellin-specific chaperone FliS